MKYGLTVALQDCGKSMKVIQSDAEIGYKYWRVFVGFTFANVTQYDVLLQ